MALIIIPIAGPDFYSIKFGVRPLYPIGESTLLEHVLSNRFWMNNMPENQIIFVLKEEGVHTKIMQEFIARKFRLHYRWF